MIQKAAVFTLSAGVITAVRPCDGMQAEKSPDESGCCCFFAGSFGTFQKVGMADMLIGQGLLQVGLQGLVSQQT